MRKTLLLLTLFVLSVTYVGAKDVLTREQAWEIVQKSLSFNEKHNPCVYVSKDVVIARSVITRIINNRISPDFDAWFFFVDDYPYQSWSHPCRYVFVDVNSGEIHINEENFPPHLDNMKCIKEVTINTPSLKLASSSSQSSSYDSPQLYSAKHDYAIIINGGINKESNHIRYWNDCSFIYSTLIKKYRYPADHVFVLMSDGIDPSVDRKKLDGSYDSSPLDLDGDGTPDIQYSATKANISLVFDSLAAKMNTDDNLFIYTIDHGTLEDGIPYLCLWGESMTGSELACQLNKLNVGTINICMGQCCSGGFISYLQRPNTVIATACSTYESSYSMRNCLYDEFVYHWTSAINGCYPNGDTVNADIDGNHKISMQEAFDYARTHDARNETPQFYVGSYSSADSLYISHIYDLEIQGNTIVCDSAVYYIDALPDDYDVLWTYSTSGLPYPQIQQNHPAYNEAMITNQYKFGYNGTLRADIYDAGELVANVSRPISSSPSSFSGTYNQESCTYYTASHPAITTTMLSTTNPMFIHQGCLVHIQSNSLKNRVITHSGANPEVFYYNGDNQIVFSLPLNSGGIPFHINVSGDGECFTTSLLFFSVSNNGNISQKKSLCVSMSDNLSVEVNLKNPNDDCKKIACYSSNENYDISVYSGKNGRLMMHDTFEGDTYKINVVDWENGLYVVRVSSGDNVLTTKMYIK